MQIFFFLFKLVKILCFSSLFFAKFQNFFFFFFFFWGGGQILPQVAVGNQKQRRILDFIFIFFIFSYHINLAIPLMDDCHFSSIAKLGKKTLCMTCMCCDLWSGAGKYSALIYRYQNLQTSNLVDFLPPSPSYYTESFSNPSLLTKNCMIFLIGMTWLICLELFIYIYILVNVGYLQIPRRIWMQGNFKLGQLGCCILKQPEICNTEFTSSLLSMSAQIMVLSVKVCPSLGLSLTL